MKRTWIPYWEWEDYHAGMWRKLSTEEELEMLPKAIIFTGDWERYGEAMGEVIKAWPRTMLNSLSNTSINRRAFLGHCAVQFKIGCPEYLTRQAWKELTNKQREDADAIAQKHINNWVKEYEKENKGIHKEMGK